MFFLLLYNDGCPAKPHRSLPPVVSPPAVLPAVARTPAPAAAGQGKDRMIQAAVLIGGQNLFHGPSHKSINPNAQRDERRFQWAGNGTANQYVDLLFLDLVCPSRYIRGVQFNHRPFLAVCSVVFQNQQLICCIKNGGDIIFPYGQSDLHPFMPFRSDEYCHFLSCLSKTARKVPSRKEFN